MSGLAGQWAAFILKKLKSRLPNCRGVQTCGHNSAHNCESYRRDVGSLEVRNSRRLPAASSSSSSASATTISAAASAVAPAATSVLSFRARLVHVERASAYLRTVQRRNGFLSIFVDSHFHEAESARASRVAVGHDADPVHLPKGLKHGPQFVFRCVKAQVPNKNILQASASALSCRSCEPRWGGTGRSGAPS